MVLPLDTCDVVERREEADEVVEGRAFEVDLTRRDCSRLSRIGQFFALDPITSMPLRRAP